MTRPRPAPVRRPLSPAERAARTPLGRPPLHSRGLWCALAMGAVLGAVLVQPGGMVRIPDGDSTLGSSVAWFGLPGGAAAAWWLCAWIERDDARYAASGARGWRRGHRRWRAAWWVLTGVIGAVITAAVASVILGMGIFAPLVFVAALVTAVMPSLALPSASASIWPVPPVVAAPLCALLVEAVYVWACRRWPAPVRDVLLPEG